MCTLKIAEKNKLINKLRMQVSRSRKPNAKGIGTRDILAEIKPHVKPAMYTLLEAQLKLSACKKKGMRWSKEMKDFTLSLMYHGPRAYRYLAKLIPLPSISTINRYQSIIHLRPGVHDHVRQFLKSNIKSWPLQKRLCSLLIDEVSLKANLENDVKSDVVVGYCDDSSTRTSKPANQAVVVAFTGLLSSWKQIIGHWFTCDEGTTDVIKKVIDDCFSLANEVGLILKVIVCDQGPKNRKFVRLRDVSEEKTYIMNGEEKVYLIWDPPHLIKSMRNNLMKHDFKWRGHTVSGRYIKVIFLAQEKMRLKLTPKLPRCHVVFRSSFTKMKVKYATQVFSYSVYTALLTFIAFKRLTPVAVHTANCVKDMNDLFDCFNSMSFMKDKFTLRYAISKNSEHIPFLKPKMLGFFQNASFLGVKRQPDCLKGWIVSIKSLLSLVEDLSTNYSMKALRTRLINQDMLENTFSVARQQHGSNDHPTCRQIERGLRITSLSSVMKISDSGNCEEEVSKAVISLSKLPKTLTARNTPLSDISISYLNDIQLDIHAELDLIEESTLYYSCGFLTRKFIKGHKCETCQGQLLVDPDERMLRENYQMFMYLKAHSDKLGSEFGHLCVPSHASFKTLKEIDNVFHQTFAQRGHERNIAVKIRLLIDDRGLSLNLCSLEAEEEFLTLYIKTRILWEVRFKNRQFENERFEKLQANKLRKVNAKSKNIQKPSPKQQRQQRKKLGQAFANSVKDKCEKANQ